MPKYDIPEDLVQKIIYYLDNDSIRESMTMAAHKRAVTSYSLESRVEDIVKYLRSDKKILSIKEN